jgi:hypothetical protein
MWAKWQVPRGASLPNEGMPDKVATEFRHDLNVIERLE